MIDRLLAFSVHQRWLVMIAVLMMGAFGVWNFTRLPIDAVPDITNVQVQINTNAPGFSPLEVEQRITFPIETGMAGLPNLVNTRSLSRYGLSQVTVVFKDGTDIYFARQLVNERVQRVKDSLPTGIETAMGPVSTGLGEIYMYTVEAKEGAKNAEGKPTRRAICGPCRTGSSSLSSATCRGSTRSTPSAASRSSSTCFRIRPG
jgi:cobalt-zinc-cadmium resistance protein CzcA